ncbi:MAG: hypothetical protein QXU26_04180 [Thermofilaceae archaeon]
MKIRIWEKVGKEMAQRAALRFSQDGQLEEMRLSYLWTLESGKQANREGLSYEEAQKRYVAQRLKADGEKLVVPMQRQEMARVSNLLRKFIDGVEEGGWEVGSER